MWEHVCASFAAQGPGGSVMWLLSAGAPANWLRSEVSLMQLTAAELKLVCKRLIECGFDLPHGTTTNMTKKQAAPRIVAEATRQRAIAGLGGTPAVAAGALAPLAVRQAPPPQQAAAAARAGAAARAQQQREFVLKMGIAADISAFLAEKAERVSAGLAGGAGAGGPGALTGGAGAAVAAARSAAALPGAGAGAGAVRHKASAAAHASSSSSSSNLAAAAAVAQPHQGWAATVDLPFQNVLLAPLPVAKELSAAAAMQGRSEDEAKVEPPSWGSLQPMNVAEQQGVAYLSRLGFSKHKSLETLRRSGGQLSSAEQRLYEELRDLQDASLMDQIALDSEKTGKVDEVRAEREAKARLVITDVLGEGAFDRSLLLDSKIGVPALREAVRIDRGVLDLSEMRECCIRLLVLEGKSVQWYGLGACSYIYELALRLHAKRTGLDEQDISAEEKHLERILYNMPAKSGDMPQDFLLALERWPTHTLKSMSGTSFVAHAKLSDIKVRDDSVQVLPDEPARKKLRAEDVIDLS